MSTDRSRPGSPPKPALVLRVGVTGHRPNRLAESAIPRLRRQTADVMVLLQSIVDEALTAHADVYSAEPPPRLRAISAIAEGADTLVAELALERGMELEAPLPFTVAEYERDFPPGAPRETFHRLLGGATAVFELDGSREHEAEAYEAVGRLVARQCDVLVAIWDGEPAAGRGGTALIAAYARRLGLPVIWIHAAKEQPPCLIAAESGRTLKQAPIETLRGRLSAILSSPGAKPPASTLRRLLGLADESAGNLLGDYFAETNPSFTWGQAFVFVRDLLIGRLHRPKLRVDDFAAATAAEWADDFAKADAALTALHAAPMVRLRAHYCWTSGLANYYGGLYRSAFTMNYLLAALAVLLAAIGLALARVEGLWTLLELACLVAIVLITMVGKTRRWHERWLTYRNLAERLRTFRFLIPLGEVPRIAPPPKHSSVDPSRIAWVDWLFRAIVREIPLPSARLDAACVGAAARFIADVEIAGQIEYHRANAERMRRVDHHLHLAGVVMFLVCIAAVVVHLVLAASEGGAAWHAGEWLGLLSAALPAFGAAFYGMRSQGEFASLVERSAMMATALGRLREQLHAPAELADHHRSVAAVAAEIADVMLVETADWHQVFGAKPLDLPA